jgi:hypothetical protein
MGRVDKLDSSFSRSRSSSMSSLENITSESVTCLAFADSYTKKSGKCVGAGSRPHRIPITQRGSLIFVRSDRSVGAVAHIVGGHQSGIGADRFHIILGHG